MQWPASEGNRQSKKYYIDCYLRSTYTIEAGSEVRTDLGPRRRRGRGKIRTKFNLRPPNGCGQHAPNRGIFLPNICADIPGASYRSANSCKFIYMKLSFATLKRTWKKQCHATSPVIHIQPLKQYNYFRLGTCHRGCILRLGWSQSVNISICFPFRRILMWYLIPPT